jgi:tetratricopeptide (TPR) repeat protein
MWSHGEKVLVDPDRGTIWMQYAIDRNGFDHTAVNLLMLQRHEGYAPYPLQLALSRFDSIDEWRVAGRKKQGSPLPDVRQWYDSWTTNDSQEMREAASAFFRFLVLRSSIDTLRKFVSSADEFDLSGQIASHYRQSFDSLVASWHGYLDTVSFLPRQMVLFSDRAAAGFEFVEARELMEQSFAYAVSDKDSSFAIEKLMSLCFAQGDFTAASRYAFLSDSLSLAGGSYAFLSGDSATGASTFRRILEKNPNDNGARFGLANIAINSGAVEKGIEFLRENIQNLNSPMAQPESRALLAASMPRKNGKRSPDTDSLLAAARFWYEQALNSEQSTPSMYVWYGIVLVAQGEYALGERALHSAALLEVRPFYRAMAYIWLGKCADLQGNRETAKLYYSQVATLNAGVYQKREAEQLMIRAFKF